ncbi:restriction system-associated AAA family ATPase [Pedobacter alluvionis]|uniref:Restriction system-associated AAA family ATPase n=1 Tax=Pedobacter alluvionis TaxID=475253 RepID=A0A497XXH2_9SPHI|nr:restriction system-associated AAA family ATPase [Pedobacter alluvionis]RLJ74663.1 restriction system-associated AAA family ATPase [Pedobacter alluvionis]TFB29808.1 restriction system-associated AAA family ATPase [Pedobacter alluvionis]
MKLLRLKILGEDFRSLPANVDYEFNVASEDSKLSTKVFAGLNGSGKSNFLELLAEIFYYLERTKLQDTPRSYVENKNFGFEIEYILPKKENNFYTIYKNKSKEDVINLDLPIEQDIHVSIKKDLEGFLEMSYSLAGEDKFTVIDDDFGQFLPSKIIAYTSGQNELLSNPFTRLRYHYFTEMVNSENKSSNRRLYFLDTESNYSIFIANMLLGKTAPLQYLKSIFRIEDLYSFRITFNYKHNTREALKILEEKKALWNPLKACATTWRDDTNSKCLVLDFMINEATHQAFHHYYKTAFKLFQAFYELQSLNLLIEKQATRKFVTNAHKTINITDELSKPDPSDLIFRIEKIRIKRQKSDDNKKDTLYYKSFSDGEHQLNEVIGSVMMMEEDGCLFLMDEPDTHFNPKWRAKMVTMLNKVSGKEYDSHGNPENIHQQELIMTTHSPFIISDNHKENVYKFVRNGKTLKLENPKHETYGTSITFLMKQIFDRDITISDYANNELKELKKEIRNISQSDLLEEKIDEVEERLMDFGESIEKFDLYNYLSQVKKK